MVPRLPVAARRAAAVLAAAVLVGAAGAGPARADDRSLARAAEGAPAVVAALAGPDTQGLYDAARDLQEALRAALPVNPGCAPLARAALGLAAGAVLAAEGVDRPDPSDVAAGRARAARAAAALAPARRACRPGPARPSRSTPELHAPRPGEAFFGGVVAAAPAGADAAEIRVDGRVAARPAPRGGWARATLRAAPGAHDVEVRFLVGGREVARARSAGVWLLPAGARRATPASSTDTRVATGLRALGPPFAGETGMWWQDLSDGRAAAWNAGARFPAASTVKLGLLLAALPRLGPAPERSALFADAAAMTTWSSNLATNRLLARLVGSGPATAALARVGATASTFTGGYLVGTEVAPGPPAEDAPDPPPRISRRVTTAADLARVLFALHAAAAGDRGALGRSGLTLHQARLALGLLLRSQPRDDNLGVFAGALAPGTAAAQKHGWFSSVRHSAAIVYSPGGARVLVCLTHRPGLTRAEASALCGRMVTLPRG